MRVRYYLGESPSAGSWFEFKPTDNPDAVLVKFGIDDEERSFAFGMTSEEWEQLTKGFHAALGSGAVPIEEEPF